VESDGRLAERGGEKTISCTAQAAAHVHVQWAAVVRTEACHALAGIAIAGLPRARSVGSFCGVFVSRVWRVLAALVTAIYETHTTVEGADTCCLPPLTVCGKRMTSLGAAHTDSHGYSMGWLVLSAPPGIRPLWLRVVVGGVLQQWCAVPVLDSNFGAVSRHGDSIDGGHLKCVSDWHFQRVTGLDEAALDYAHDHAH